MCGIFFYQLVNQIFNSETIKVLERNFNRIQHRGPDNSQKIIYQDKFLGFHRLSINGLSEQGNQPFSYKNNFVLCNGEIYNYKELAQKHDIQLNEDDSDCAIIWPLYQKIGLKIFQELDGVFAIIIVDDNKVIVGRDPIGVRPLFYGIEGGKYAFCSEAKGLFDIIETKPFPPKHFMVFEEGVIKNFEMYEDIIETNKTIKDAFYSAIEKRMMSDRPIGALLSGGLDSSLVAGILSKKITGKLRTYSIGFPESQDLKYAREVSDFIGSEHHEVLLNEEEVIKELPMIINCLETWDTTTVRASVGMYFLSKYIRELGKDIVIYSGEGADELMQGYLYFHYQPSKIEGMMESKRLVDNLYYYDVLRADRTTANFGLELRVPFLDKELRSCLRNYDLSPQNKIEKYVLRDAFRDENVIPESVLWRQKEAFSDGVSGKKSFYRVLQEHIETLYSDEEFRVKQNVILHSIPKSKEAMFYRDLFYKIYGNRNEEWIPSYWMPRWCETDDPSARTLNVHEMN